MKRRDVVDLLLLAMLWGGSFLFMRLSVPEFGPMPMVEMRVAIAALFLLPVVLALVYALYRLVGGSPYVPLCAPAECPFGPGSSDALFMGFLAVPFAVSVIHLWLLRTRSMRSNISLQADRER